MQLSLATTGCVPRTRTHKGPPERAQTLCDYWGTAGSGRLLLHLCLEDFLSVCVACWKGRFQLGAKVAQQLGAGQDVALTETALEVGAGARTWRFRVPRHHKPSSASYHAEHVGVTCV